jgi:hypothetical protein
LQYIPDITQLLPYGRPNLTTASMSEDVTSLPKMYLLSDLNEGNVSVVVSAIVKINGMSAELYLETLSNFIIYHDIDARYNAVGTIPQPAIVLSHIP